MNEYTHRGEHMIKELELLIMLHDIDIMIKEVTDEEIAAEAKDLGFEIDRLDYLNKAREDLTSEIDRDLLRHYQRIYRKYGRAIVPVVKGACTGCFVRLPISLVSGIKQNDRIVSCENCGRFLYYVS
jgi:hypothetical protein